jgi:pilus assembly protein CpaB
MAAVLAPGDRAVTVNVTPSTGMAGFLYPGDRVDILLTQTIQSSGAGSARHVSETILHGVKVVGLDQTLSDKKDDAKGLGVPKTATLEVTPKQAEIVAVATDIGVLTLALDSVADPSRQGAPQAVTKTWDTEATQIAVAAPASSAPRAAGRSPAPPVWTVDVVRGGASASAPFPMAAVGRPVIGS